MSLYRLSKLAPGYTTIEIANLRRHLMDGYTTTAIASPASNKGETMSSTAIQVADEVAAYHARLIEKGLDIQLVADVTRDLAHAVHHGHYPYAVATS